MEEKKPKFSQEQYDLLLKSSKEKNGCKLWNEWRKDNQDTKIELAEAHLERAHLERANLEGANLLGAHLFKTHLERANLRGAHLEGANLLEAHLEGASLETASLEGAHLLGARLERANLFKTHFEEAFLLGAHLEGAYLAEAHLEGAILRGAHLEGAHLLEAHLERANLRGAHLEEAILLGAHLEGANLLEAHLEGAHVTNIKYNRKTRYRGIRVATCYGSPRFKRFAQDQDFIEELRESSKLGRLIYSLWLIFADCGRSLWPWVLWSVFFAVYFGVNFFWMGQTAFKVDDLGWSLSSMLYYSVVTFTTLGFGDITPVTQKAAFWIMFEVILGYVMLGGLISIFSTKLARRS